MHPYFLQSPGKFCPSCVPYGTQSQWLLLATVVHLCPTVGALSVAHTQFYSRTSVIAFILCKWGKEYKSFIVTSRKPTPDSLAGLNSGETQSQLALRLQNKRTEEGTLQEKNTPGNRASWTCSVRV